MCLEKEIKEKEGRRKKEKDKKRTVVRKNKNTEK